MPTGRPGTTEEGFCATFFFALIASWGFFFGQPSNFPIQGPNNCKQPFHPLCRSFSSRQPHLLGVLVTEEPLSQGSVPPLHDSLVPVDIDPAAPDLGLVLGQQLVDSTHELTPGVDLQKLRPLQGPPFVDARQGIGDLCCAFASQRLSLLTPRGNVNYGEGLLIGPPTNAVVGKKEQVGLVDLIWYPDIKLRSRYVSRSRQVDLPDCLFLQPVLGHILRNLGCRRQMFDGCDSLPIAPGAIIDPCQLCCQAGVH